jgi:hypothetical protein
VALTGLIPSATGYGSAVQDACALHDGLAPVTTGHATTVAAVILNLVSLLQESGRDLVEETVMFYGIGSIGLGALRLMLDVLPHPASLRLCDPFRSASYFKDLERTLREEHGFRGIINAETAGNGAKEPYDASVIIGATNVEDVLDLARLAPGTLIVDDSSPHCLNGPAAFSRLSQNGDLLFTEGGFIRGQAPMPRIAYIPPAVSAYLPAKLPQLFFSMLRAEDITACILSALLSARRPGVLPPTVGLITPAAARQHWVALQDFGFSAAELNYEGAYLPRHQVSGFREQFGSAAVVL